MNDSMGETIDKEDAFLLGKIGGAIPLMVFFIVMLLLSVMGYTNGKCFWAAGILGVLSGFFVIKDKNQYEEILINGISNKGLGKIIVMFFMTGIISAFMSTCGLCSSLLYLAVLVHLPSGLLPAIIFIFSILITFATGATTMTIAAVTPIFFPVAVQLGCHPGVIMGAILGGGLLGDNVAPITTSNIVAAMTQGTTVAKVTAQRSAYSIVTAILSTIIYIKLGMCTASKYIDISTLNNNNLKNLIMLMGPIVLVILISKGKNMIYALCVELLCTIGISMLLGNFTIENFFGLNGTVVIGISNSLTVVILCMMIYMILEIVNVSGIFEVFSEKVLGACKNYKVAELFAAISVAIGAAMLGGAAYAILLLGPLDKKLFHKFHLDSVRAGSILGCYSSAIVGLIPFSTVVLYAITMAVTTGFAGEEFSALDIIPYTYPSMILMGLYFVTILFNIGNVFSRQENKEHENCSI